jgi:hypothetical protein
MPETSLVGVVGSLAMFLGITWIWWPVGVVMDAGSNCGEMLDFVC